MPQKNRFWDSLEYTLGLAALVGLFLLIYLNMSIELHDPDIWLHLKTGEYIIQHKSIPRVDIFSSTMSGKAWVDHSWLVQVIFFLVFRLGGADNLILFSSFLVTSAFLFLFLTLYKKRNQLTLILIILFTAILASRMRFNIRPENFSILFFSIYLFLLKKVPDKKWIFLLVLVQLLWVNCHGFFILGPLLVAIFILTEAAKKYVRLPWEWNAVERLDSHSYSNILKVFPLILAACFINPYGYKGAFYPLKITLDTIGKSNIFYRYIIELLPAWQLNYQSIYSYYVLIAITLIFFLLNFKKINLGSLLLWLIFLALSFRVSRNILYFNFIAVLTTADVLTKGLDLKITKLIHNLFARLVYILRYAVIVIIIIFSLKENYRILRNRYYVFDEDYSKSVLLGTAARGYPKDAADFIIENDLPGNIFNLFNYGSYLIYRLSPQKKVFIDGRTELYGEDFFKSLQRIINLDKKTIDSTLNKYGIKTILLSGDTYVVGNLGCYFLNSPEWSLVFFDRDSLIFLKNEPQNKILIEKLKVDIKIWQTKNADLKKLGIRDIFPEPYVKRTWILYYLGLYEQAIQEAKEALKILPSSADAYNIIARIYIEQRLFDKAYEFVRLSYIYGPSQTESLITLGSWYRETAKSDLAIKVYKKLVRLNPYFARAHYLLALSYQDANKERLAIKQMQEAIRLNPFTLDYYKKQASWLTKIGDLKGVSQLYKEALACGLDLNRE